MNKNGCRTLLFWAVCFTLPIAMLAVQSVWAGTYPFGAQSFLADDLRYQYIDFFTWYRSLLCGQGSIFYSFAQGMGSNTWGLYSYYLASPFNLVTLLFDQNHLTLAIYVIVALKLGCMQLAMTWYLKKRFSLSPAWALTLGLCYTWSTWTVTNLRNPLWLDALIILPLAAWCCHRLIIGGSFAPLAAIVAIDGRARLRPLGRRQGGALHIRHRSWPFALLLDIRSNRTRHAGRLWLFPDFPPCHHAPRNPAWLSSLAMGTGRGTAILCRHYSTRAFRLLPSHPKGRL